MSNRNMPDEQLRTALNMRVNLTRMNSELDLILSTMEQIESALVCGERFDPELDRCIRALDHRLNSFLVLSYVEKSFPDPEDAVDDRMTSDICQDILTRLEKYDG